jgi:uncharacterized protein involved in outer membrane biogenesis
MAVSKILRWSLYGIGGLIAALLLVILVLAFLRIPIDLSAHKSMVESAAGLALGRSVKVDDRIVITTSLRPIFSLERLRIENPKDFGTGDFLTMNSARIQLKLLPLLMGKVHIAEIRVKGFSVNLAVNQDGVANWTSRRAPSETKTPAVPDERKRPEAPQLQLTSDSLVLTEVTLEDISVSYRSPDTSEALQFKIDTCKGRMLPGDPFDLTMQGIFLQEPFSSQVKIGSLQELLEKSASWMEIRTEIAKTRFDFAGRLDLVRAASSLNLKTAVSGDRLDSLNGLLKLDLPPLQSYHTAADLTLRRQRIDLTDLTIQVGDSRLQGTMSLEKNGPRLKSNLDFNSPMIQLDDFELGDWSPEAGDPEKTAGGHDAAKSDAKGGERVRELLSPEVLEKIDARLMIKAKRVLSGSDELGSGSMTATVNGGRFSVDPLKLNIPGGTFVLAAVLKPDPRAPEASLRIVTKNFDFGIPVRRVNPKGDMGGHINLDVDLISKADSFDRLMANGRGHFDYSGRLENIKAGIIDLWAVNLIAAIVSREDDSKINCVVGRWTMKEGVLTPEVFLIDTTRIRICGRGQADFKNDRIELAVTSRPKRPEFFNLATPVEIKGSLSDFGIGIPAGGLVGTVVKFVTSPVHVPIRRLAGEKLPAGGDDVCGMPIGGKERAVEAPPGCK